MARADIGRRWLMLHDGYRCGFRRRGNDSARPRRPLRRAAAARFLITIAALEDTGYRRMVIAARQRRSPLSAAACAGQDRASRRRSQPEQFAGGRAMPPQAARRRGDSRRPGTADLNAARQGCWSCGAPRCASADFSPARSRRPPRRYSLGARSTVSRWRRWV